MLYEVITRRLQIENAEIDPAGGPHGGFSHQQHRRQQGDVETVEEKTEVLEVPVVDGADGGGDQQADAEPVDLLEVT